MESYLFSFQMMHTSQFHKTDPYDWFCGRGSHLADALIQSDLTTEAIKINKRAIIYKCYNKSQLA